MHSMSAKRARTSSDSFSESPSSDRSHSSEPTPKAARTNLPASSHPLLCTLPPTCNPPQHRPTPIAGTAALEAHYATFHAHVCEERGCGCVFPDARLLELHQTECHDPLVAVRKERGEKIFACHLATCPRHFLTPKARRLHLIGAHGYPKEYFFAVTNKGIGGLLQRWGEGASLLRGQWHAREGAASLSSPRSSHSHADEDEDDDDDDDDADTLMDIEPQKQSDFTLGPSHESPPDTRALRAETEAVLSLTDTLSSLSLIPTNITFGRGTRRGRFVPPSPHSNTLPRGRGRGIRGHLSSTIPAAVGGRGRAIASGTAPAIARGRGRGSRSEVVTPRGGPISSTRGGRGGLR